MPKRAKRAELLKALVERLGVRIDNFELLDRALTHASIAAEREAPIYDYEALEFLGDAVLGLAVADHLLEHKPDSNPGEYRRLRAALVNRNTLARIARGRGIADAIRLGKGEELSGGRQRTALLADCLESLIGAVYLDQGWQAARQFVIRVTHADFDDAMTREASLDHKSRLQHYCQAERYPLPRFALVRSEGPDHRKEFEVEVYVHDEPYGRGTGFSKKEAEQGAAHAALVALGVYEE